MGLKLKLIVYPLSLIKQSGVFIVYFVEGTGGKAQEKTLCDLCVTTGPGTRTIGISPSLESTPLRPAPPGSVQPFIRTCLEFLESLNHHHHNSIYWVLATDQVPRIFQLFSHLILITTQLDKYHDYLYYR